METRVHHIAPIRMCTVLMMYAVCLGLVVQIARVAVGHSIMHAVIRLRAMCYVR